MEWDRAAEELTWERLLGKAPTITALLDCFLVKGIVSRDLHICFLIPFDRSEVSTHQERVLLLLKFRFRVEFFNFRVSA
jgi:hypothetical protein